MTSVSTSRRQGLNSSAAIKVACRVATTGNITLAALQTIDGVALASGDRVLVKDQTNTAENGIYVADTGNWSRDIDFDGAYDVLEGTIVTVARGTLYSATLWRVSTVSPVIGSALAFVQSSLSPADSNNVQFLQSGTGAGPRTLQAKDRDIVSVLDFYADGVGTSSVMVDPTGSVDSTLGIQAAINTGRGVYFPDGTYKLTSGLTVSTAGQKLIFESRNAILSCATDFTALTLAASFVEIESGKILGAAADTTSTTAGILISNCTRGRIAFTRVEGFGYGISMRGATSNWVNTLDSLYLYSNKRAGAYACGHGTTFVGGEIAGSVYGVLQADVQAGTALAIDRDATAVLGQSINLFGTVIEGIGTATKAITGCADNGAGLIRVTCVGHGYTTGDAISVTGVTGTTEANGVWPVTVIDADNYDLKTSAFVNAYVSGGTARRGAALYWGVGQSGPNAEGLYIEDVPVVFHAGDAFKNDGTTAHSTIVLGGKINCRAVGNAAVQSALVVNNRCDQVQVIGNYSSGSQTTLISSRGANAAAEIQNFGNRGFTRQFDATGTQAGRNTIIKPTTRNGDVALEVQIPASSGSSTLTTALMVANYGGATYTVYIPYNLLVNAQIRGASNMSENWGSGSPEAALAAVVGSTFHRSDGGANTSIYIKESGTGNTGWVAK